MQKYVIIGSGIAGVSAAKEIRKKDKEGKILLIGKEANPPYFRIQLSALLKEADPALPLLEKEGWAEALGIELRLGTEVTHVDFDAMEVTLDDGSCIAAEKILIANGSHANLPPFNNSDLRGVFTLRSFDDLLEIKDFLGENKRVGVIGGGLLGLEAAKSLQLRGHDVAIIDMEEVLLSKQLDRELGMLLNEEMKDNGFMVYTNRATKGFIGTDVVEGIEFSSGEVIDVDAVLVSTGVRSNIGVFQGTSLETNRGVVVDRFLKTNIDNVWAAGDVAEIDGRTMGIWPAARAMGKVAGANMAGGSATYEDPSVFTKLDIGDIEVFSAGKIDTGDVYFYDDEKNHYRLYVEDGRVVGVILYNDTKAMNTFRKFVEEGASIDEAQNVVYPFKREKA